MAGDDIKAEVTKVHGLDDKLKKAEAGHDDIGALLAHQALDAELKRINSKHDPNYANRVMTALQKVDPNPAFKLDHGQLEITPLKSGGDHGQRAAGTGARVERAQAADVDPRSPEQRLASDSAYVERELLRGGNNSLYDKVARLPENATGVGPFKSNQDPNSPDTILRRDDFQRYYDHMMKDQAHWTDDDKRQMTALKTLLANYGNIARNIGDTDLGAVTNDSYLISKKAMGMNMARAAAHALLDGGANNLFDKINKEQGVGDGKLHGYSISLYLDKHPEVTGDQRRYLQALAGRMDGNQDWVAGLIGEHDGQNYLTKDSIARGLREYDLDSFVVK